MAQHGHVGVAVITVAVPVSDTASRRSALRSRQQTDVLVCIVSKTEMVGKTCFCTFGSSGGTTRIPVRCCRSMTHQKLEPSHRDATDASEKRKMKMEPMNGQAT